MRKNMREIRLGAAVMAAALVMAPVQTTFAAEAAEAAAGRQTLQINEINSSPDDWVECINTGTEAMDISGYEIRDNSDDHRWKFPEGTVVEAGKLILVDANTVGQRYDDQSAAYVEGTFQEALGIGSGDSVRLYDQSGQMVDEYSWTSHASYEGSEAAASYGRYPDGTGAFVVMPETPGMPNGEFKAAEGVNAVVLNEVQSKDPAGGPDWIELANPTGETIDITGLVIKDDDDTHAYTVPEGTCIPAGGYQVFTDEQFGFGLGKNDMVRLFYGEELLASTTWADHTNPTWGLYPDVNGTEYRNTSVATPGAANQFDEAPVQEVQEWPGDGEVKVCDGVNFLEDSSGLDFRNGQLYAVDNGGGTFWILNVAKDGTLSFADGFEQGKRVRFQKDAGNPKAAGPDTEGISVDDSGFVYFAVERDNSAKGVNYNAILKVDPKTEGTDLTAVQEWNLTESLPQVAANTGIEAVEWVAASEVNGKLYDQNTNAVFDIGNYPNASAGGVFFVALEDNGHVYAYVLNQDSTVVQIADLDATIGGAMALDYDTYEHVLWVASDNGYGNMMAKMTFTGEKEAAVTLVKPAAGVDTTKNNEGFAIADAEYTVDGKRPVYRFEDGVKEGALTVGSMACDYKASEKPEDKPEKPDVKPETKPGVKPENSGNAGGSGNNGTVNKGNVVKADQPKTGDYASRMLLPAFAVAASGIIGAGAVLYRRRRCR